MTHRPTISVLLCTYNRSGILPVAIKSVLNQSYTDFELVIVNNGSTDDTSKILDGFREDQRIRVLQLPTNLGCSGGYNYGLDRLRGTWFTTLADDDWLMEDALESLIRIPQEVDPTVDAVTANCVVKSTGELAGKGVNENQYLDAATVISKCTGEFMGMTKLALLGDLRFNEKLPGNESTLWYRIDAVANRYYIHKPLKVFQDEGATVSNLNGGKSISLKKQVYQGLLEEYEYWQILKKYHARKYYDKCFKGWLFLTISNENEDAAKYLEMLWQGEPGPRFKILWKVLNILGTRQLAALYRIWPRRFFSSI